MASSRLFTRPGADEDLLSAEAGHEIALTHEGLDAVGELKCGLPFRQTGRSTRWIAFGSPTRTSSSLVTVV